MLTGFFIKSEQGILVFLKKRALRLYIPYLIAGIISLLIFSVLGTFAMDRLGGNYELDIFENLKGLFYGNGRYNLKYNLPLWYIPFVFITELICYLIIKGLSYINLFKNKLYFLIIGLIFFVFGYFLNDYLSSLILPFGLENFILLTGFVFIGYGSFSLINDIKSLKIVIPLFVSLLLLAFSFVIFHFNSGIDYVSVAYKNYPLFVLGALFVNMALFLLIPNLNIIFTKYGQSTLFIMLFHKFPLLFFQVVISITHEWLLSSNLFVSTLTGFIVSIIAVVLCLLMEIIFLVSKNRVLLLFKKI